MEAACPIGRVRELGSGRQASPSARPVGRAKQKGMVWIASWSVLERLPGTEARSHAAT